jgi:hypothetical protein
MFRPPPADTNQVRQSITGPRRKRPSRRDAETAMDRVEGKPTAIDSLRCQCLFAPNGLTREFFP